MRSLSSLLTSTLLVASPVALAGDNPFTLDKGHPLADLSDSDMSREQALDGGPCDTAPGAAQSKTRQALVDVYYWGLRETNGTWQGTGMVNHGQVVVDADRADEVRAFFDVAYKTRFPITSVIPVSDARFDWWDLASQRANNTSAWNYRGVGSKKGNCPVMDSGRIKASKHASAVRGAMALDVNPAINPYCHSGICEPDGAQYNASVPGTLTRDSAVLKVALAPKGQAVTVMACDSTVLTHECELTATTFAGLGWSWGGDWQSPDYQHLQR